MSDQYYDLEQLERRLLLTKVEIQQIRRKILVELIVTSVFLVYISRFFFELTSFLWLAIPLSVNIFSWALWIVVVARRAFRTFSPHFERDPDFAHVQVSDDYRAHQFHLALLTRQESLFDLLTGIQFFAIAVIFFAALILGSWW